MVRLIANVIGVGIETADMLVQEVLSRNLRDRRAVARLAGLTGSPNESGSRRRDRGLAKSGNARVRRGLIQLAWRFLRFQKDSSLPPVVPHADRGAGRRAEDKDDRGARPKAAHRVLAHGHGRRNPGRLRVAAAGLSGQLGNSNKQFGVRSDFPEWPSMIRGGADPDGRLAPTPQGEWARRLGALPPKRMVASWSGSITVQPDTRTRRTCCPRRRAPLGSSECIDRSKRLFETEEVRSRDGLTNKSPYKRRPWESLSPICPQSRLLDSAWPSTSFKFSALMLRAALWSPKGSDATSCWSFSLRCRRAWLGLRRAAQRIIGRAS